MMIIFGLASRSHCAKLAIDRDPVEQCNFTAFTESQTNPSSCELRVSGKTQIKIHRQIGERQSNDREGVLNACFWDTTYTDV